MPVAFTSPLTGVTPEPALATLVQLLDAAGLELWQAPEGFWTIRAKPAVVIGDSGAARASQRRRTGRAD